MISAHESDWDAHDVEVEVRLVDGRVVTGSAQRLLCSRSTADGSTTPLPIHLGDPPPDVRDLDLGPEFALERITVQLSDSRGLARWERRTDYGPPQQPAPAGTRGRASEFREVRVRKIGLMITSGSGEPTVAYGELGAQVESTRRSSPARRITRSITSPFSSNAKRESHRKDSLRHTTPMETSSARQTVWRVRHWIDLRLEHKGQKRQTTLTLADTTLMAILA